LTFLAWWLSRPDSKEYAVSTKDENTYGDSDLRPSDRGQEAYDGPGQRHRNEDCSETADELKAQQDKYLRLAAEFENYKRLAQRDQREHARFANENVLKDMLPIVDNLDRAIHFAKASPDKGSGLIQGVELTLKQFLETLEKYGVKRITSIGERFDPSRHEAVAQVDSGNAPETTVLHEHQPGYLLHERILRPSMVTVAAAPNSARGSVPETEEGEHHG
jgi:molecular chaperone GrpE